MAATQYLHCLQILEETTLKHHEQQHVFTLLPGLYRYHLLSMVWIGVGKLHFEYVLFMGTLLYEQPTFPFIALLPCHCTPCSQLLAHFHHRCLLVLYWPKGKKEFKFV